ncbi:S41 family peptidase [Flavobacterium frigoris]|uniref:Peptidase, S41 family n=1 Tax=Flavobacterium frigoris (strain PS1) TaxID=1086011 RepID=H7FU63_FLAFP|nr:S41 family peptidase [Flavobacterium frigoris]EIA07915.1 peptidase, S41 family [Flavobacterium frigoris PS1]
MRKAILLVLTMLLFVQCASVKKHNVHLNDSISIKNLKSDVAFTYRKLQKLHPNLYWYISKKELDYKFDSLKSSITKPMLPFDFYTTLSPVVAAVRQGHLTVIAPSKKFTKKEVKALLKKGIGPFSQFDYELLNNKLYVVKNKSNNKTIKAGTEVIAANGVNAIDLINKNSHFFSSDGFNTTFKNRSAGKRFSSYFTNENGIKDSVQFNFKFNDSLKTVTISRKKEDTLSKLDKKNKKEVVSIDKVKSREIQRKKRVNGYNKDEKNYIHDLRFLEKDSSVAIMKISGFKKGNFRTFYKESFSKIEEYKSNTLILDLRDNGGGRLSEIVNLYSYLADSSFVFLDKSEVVSKSSLFNGAYWFGGSFPIKALKVFYSPLVYGYLLLTVHKQENGKNYYATHTRLHKVNKDAFQGKIYVLINGGSFSASSILSTNLQGSKRAFFVGAETGGAYNGTVAGFMPIIKLPNSDLQIRSGIMQMGSKFKMANEGHGIFPDKEVIPTIEDRIKGIDPELEWVLKDIKNQDSDTSKENKS